MSNRDIAIIGMAGRFPGAPDIDRYWANLRDGVESIRPLTDEELLAAGVLQAELDDPSYVKVCPVLEGIDLFDAAFFGFNPREAAVMDPAHRLFLEVAWEAMEHAGHTALPHEGMVGVFAGSGAPYYLMDHVRRDRSLMRSMGEFLVRHTNNDMNFLAPRVSYQMDLRGPSVNVQTACSTALVAVHMACESIRLGDCDLAIAGGSTVLIPDRQGYMYQEGEILSPDGHCRPFDAKSAGTVFGSGSGCVVLRSLSAALDDGDTIHAVVKGSAVNNDGALRVGFLAPGVEGQSAAVGKALDAAGVSAESITYIEAHGTGTSVGDPIEVAGLNDAYRPRTDRRDFCAIGSVKSNVGHLGEAAGIASLIKAVLALKHGQLPPSLGFDVPSPSIDFADSPFFVNDRLREWRAEGPRRCGVTALGAGGTNCHMILEEAPEELESVGGRSAHLLVLSARTPEALEERREDLAAMMVEDDGTALADIAWTLAVGRRTMSKRNIVVGRDRADLIRALRSSEDDASVTVEADDAERSVVFMFPGGGAQHPRMGIGLYESEPEYRAAADACFEIINPVLGRRLQDLVFCDEREAEAAATKLERPSLTLPALFTTEYALAKLFGAWGVEPVALLGHSMGEYVAACLSGVMELDDALHLVMLRGRLFETVPKGGMLSVPLGEEALLEVMPEGLSIAAVNAADLCVASGPDALLDQLEGRLTDLGIESTRIRIDIAAHSAMLEPILDEFRDFCRTISFKSPRVPFVSNVTGRWITAEQATDPNYWVEHLRSTVRFADGLETLRTGTDYVLLEIGPGRTLASLARAQNDPARFALNSMRHPDEPTDDLAFALTVFGRLWLAGVQVDWTAFYDGQLLNRVPLPVYPWDRSRYWIDRPAAGSEPETPPAGTRRTRIGDWFERPTWRQTMAPPGVVTSEEHVLVFADDTGLSRAIAGRLEAAGRTVTRVVAGEAWARDGDTYTIRPAAPEDYEGLMRAVVADRGLPTSIVHAWGVTNAPLPLSDTLDRTFHSLHNLARALGDEDVDAELTLNVVTSDLQRIGGERRIDPTKALGLGPARVMPREFPNVRSRAIDVVIPTEAGRLEALAGLVTAEIASDPVAETVAFRGHDRFESVLESVRLDPVTSRLRLRGTYLITGGLGGIGYALAEHLARNYDAKLSLIGRGATRERARARVDALEALGAEVEVIQADVANEEQIRAAVQRTTERFGALDGVFHVAGTLGDSLMPLKTREDAERVLAPKVQGTIALDAAVTDQALDLFVLFSSISSVAGLAGQADYTAANAFLDAFAQERSTRDDALTVAVNWSAWREVGMAANIASGAGAAGGAGMHEDVHPVLGRRIWAAPEAELFAAELSVENDWVLGEHRIRAGSSLMPGTGMVEIVRAAMEARPRDGTLEIQDLAFISAFVVPDDGPREMRVHVSRKDGGARSVVVAGRIVPDDGDVQWQEHVTATVGYVDGRPPEPLDIDSIRARCSFREERFAPDQESVHMDFGGRWKNLKSIRFGEKEALVSLELATPYVDDLDTYRLHPALLDMATGRCEGLIPGFDPGTDFYVPLSYTRIRMHEPLVSRLYSHVRVAESDYTGDDLIVFDVTITNESGEVLVEVDEFVMTRIRDTQDLQGTPQATNRRSQLSFEPPSTPTAPPPLVRMLEAAIGSAEGMEVLEILLSGPALPQVYATPTSVATMIGELRQPPGPAASVRKDVVEEPTLPVHEVEAALLTHEVVRECGVLQRRNRPGELKLVAYVAFEPGEQATVSDLRRFLKALLPKHLVPSTYVDLDELPKQADGGLDLQALPDPFGAADDTVEPRTETEILIGDIWKEVLGVDRVSVYDNFFDAGGHSLLAVRVVVKISKKIGIRLQQSTMVVQTLEQMAAECDRRLAETAATESTEPPTPAPASMGKRLFGGLRRK